MPLQGSVVAMQTLAQRYRHSATAACDLSGHFHVDASNITTVTAPPLRRYCRCDLSASRRSSESRAAQRLPSRTAAVQCALLKLLCPRSCLSLPASLPPSLPPSLSTGAEEERGRKTRVRHCVSALSIYYHSSATPLNTRSLRCTTDAGCAVQKVMRGRQRET